MQLSALRGAKSSSLPVRSLHFGIFTMTPLFQPNETSFSYQSAWASWWSIWTEVSVSALRTSNETELTSHRCCNVLPMVLWSSWCCCFGDLGGLLCSHQKSLIWQFLGLGVHFFVWVWTLVCLNFPASFLVVRHNSFIVSFFPFPLHLLC